MIVTATGGDAKSKLWIQIKADLIDINFLVPECNETACLGAAMIGAAGTGEYSTINEIVWKWVKIKEMISPDQEVIEKYKSFYIRNKL
jgi:sugar (pentulose or hexulose) kinase